MATHYEMLCIFPGTVAETEISAQAEAVKETVVAAGAAEIALHDMGKTRLAYPIKHIRYGYFFIIRFALETEHMAELSRKLKLNTDLLRHVLTVIDPAKAKDVPASQETVNEIVRGGHKVKKDRPEGKKEAPKSDKKKEDQEKEAKSEEKNAEEDTNSVPLEMIDEQLDEILEKSISDV